MPTLETTDGQPVAVDPDVVNQQFAASMAAEPGPAEKAPPKRQAPAEGTVVKPKSGRPPKGEKARTTAKPATVLDDGQRAQGVQGVVQLGAGIALMLGKATHKEAFTADAVTIASSAEQIADACVQTAKADPKFAAALDKVCSAGPYAALITVGVSIASQIARNHKPDLNIPGTVNPAELLKAQDDAEAQAKETVSA